MRSLIDVDAGGSCLQHRRSYALGPKLASLDLCSQWDLSPVGSRLWKSMSWVYTCSSPFMTPMSVRAESLLWSRQFRALP